jgi:predicted  nucleic acid-binding Zn-ribbon protein
MAKKVTTKKSTAEAEQAPVQEIVYRNEVDEAIEKRLVALYTLQRVDSEINKIQIIRGELPQAIEDLEDELAGLQTRIDNFNKDIANNNDKIAAEKNKINEGNDRVAVLKDQQNNVRNNREFDSIQKELDYRDLETQLCERHIKDATARIKEINTHIDAAKKLMDDKSSELQQKKDELDDIINETEQEESRLQVKSKEQENYIDERYLTAYKRIRDAAHNGLAVVKIDRDACGGCFSQIPPQRQMEIKMHKKVIVCEHCGRILVDDDIAEKAEKILQK